MSAADPVTSPKGAPKAAARRGQCSVCRYRFRLRKDGTVRVHYLYHGNERDHLPCKGSEQPPRGAGQDAPPELRHIEMPITAGAKLTIWLPPGNDLADPLPALGHGFTVDVCGQRWRATVETLAEKRKGHLVELTIEGRYAER